MFSDISQNWKKILLGDGLNNELRAIRNKIKELTPNNKLCPPKEKTFEFARLTPLNDIKVIVIGQDPYHSIGDAHGLSFSSLNKKTPPSLKNIYSCLINHKLIKEMPTSSDLTPWAKQGVLLINAALSTEQGSAGLHMKYWTNYTIKIIKRISDYGIKNDKIYIYLLWGNFAQNFRNYISEKHIILEWIHPSPMAQSRAAEDKKFVNCDHFIKVNSLIESWGNKPINWSLKEEKKEKLKVFTDGSCTGNGKKTAIGGYAAIFVEGPWKDKQLCDSLCNTTNIRAEGTAIIKVLEELKNNPYDWDECEIYSDSDFWLKMLTTYMPKWNSSTFDSKANPDLTKYMWKLWNELKSMKKLVCVIWVPAHNKLGYKDSNDPYEKFCYINNDKVDKLATSMTEKLIQ